VIGADGRHSLVARQVGAAIYDAAPARTVQYYSYWSGTGADKVELFFQQRRGATLAPTNDGLAVVVAAWPIEWFKTVRQDVDRHTWSVFDLWPDLAERLRAGRREERFTGTIDVGGFYRTPWGPGWALVGDAGYMKDPITAQGITDAFRDAELLAAAADRGLREPASMLGELQAYERERNALSRGSYRTTCELARLEPPPPDQWRLLHALRGNQQQIDRFFGVTGGTYPARDFYSAENVAEILAAASTDQPE
jgi:flavin-dependent dehydrogenase